MDSVFFQKMQTGGLGGGFWVDSGVGAGWILGGFWVDSGTTCVFNTKPYVGGGVDAGVDAGWILGWVLGG